MADFFAALERAAETAVFEPQEFIEAGENVTVLGWVKSTDCNPQMARLQMQIFQGRDGDSISFGKWNP